MRVYVWLPALIAVLCLAYYLTCYIAVHHLLKRFLSRVEPGALGIDYGEQYESMLGRAEQWLKENPEAMVYTQSHDGLRLAAHWWDRGRDTTVIFVHGYGNTGTQAALIGDFILNDLNANLLAPDCRTHGKSEGRWVGFGWPDRFDLLQWIDKVLEKKGSSHSILLLGLSMGGATVLCTVGETLPENVCAVCSDCGYSSLSELFSYMLRNSFHLPQYTVMAIVDGFFKKRFGYSVYEVQPIEQVRKASVPILFIHGEADRFIPSYMCRDLFDACPTPKELLIVPKADHALSSVLDWKGYSDAMKNFCSKYNRQETTMTTVNYLSNGEGTLGVNYSLNSLGIMAREGEEDLVSRVAASLISSSDFLTLDGKVKCIGVTERFKDIIKTFDTPKDETPAGFRIESVLDREGLLCVDLVRDINYDKNGVKRPTGVVFSADSANPYEVAPIAPLLGNLTCNPGIVYDLFINNPKANVGGKFKTRDEVMTELGRVLGPGCDISVELNNPFEKDFDKILEECERFKEILSEYRLVVKVPHMGPVNAENVGQLLSGDKKLDVRYDTPATEDAFRSHNLALKLREHGYRINYTLMFEPYQAALALQARPYFINCFVRHRLMQSQKLALLVKNFDLTSDERYLEDIRAYLLTNDYLSSRETERSYKDVLKLARDVVNYRGINDESGSDGLDEARHCLRLLRSTNMRDTRLIICSMEGEYNYPDIDRLMADPEYQDVIDRVVITAEPSYLARFTSTNQVVTYQRRFMNAAAGQK